MAEHTGIAYTHHSIGFWRGCHPVAPGCGACFAARDMRRYGHDPHAVVRAVDATFYAPRKWNRAAAAARERRRVFVTPWSDFWIEEADGWRADALDLIAECTMLDFVSPSKRLHRARFCRMPPNFWPLASVSVQADLDATIPHLFGLESGPRVLGLSYEPALGPVDFTASLAQYAVNAAMCGMTPTGRIGWLIAGCESASHTKPGRPAELDWFRVARDACVAAVVPYFLKQAAGPDGNLVHSPELDGRRWLELPHLTPPPAP